MEAAIDFYQQALVIDGRSATGMGKANDLAIVASLMKNREESPAHCRQALKIYEGIKSPTVDKVRGWLECATRSSLTRLNFAQAPSPKPGKSQGGFTPFSQS